MENVANAFVRTTEGGSAVWWSRGSIVVVRADSAETGGSMAFAEQFCPRDYETPIHVHNQHDEILLSHEGEFAVYYDDQFVRLTPGDFVYVPKGAPHGFRNESESTARLYALFEPGLERGFLRAGVPTEVPTGELPSPPPAVAEAEKILDIEAVYDTEIVGPLPSRDETA